MDGAALPAGREGQHTRSSPDLEEHETMDVDTTGSSRSTLEEDQSIPSASNSEVDLRTTQPRLIDRQHEINPQHIPYHGLQQRTAPSTDVTRATRLSRLSLEQGRGDQLTISPEADQRTVHSLLADQQQEQRIPQSNISHPILAFEALSGYLSEHGSETADRLFAQVKGDPIEELKTLFASVRQQLDKEWAVVEQKEMAFAAAENDIFQYGALLTGPDDAKTKTVDAIVHLVQINIKNYQQAAGTLYDLLWPQKKTDQENRARLMKDRKIFETFDETTR